MHELCLSHLDVTMKKTMLFFKNTKVIVTIIAAIFIAEILYSYHYFSLRYYLNCSSTFEFMAPQHQFSMQGTLSLKMERSGQAQIGLDGLVVLKKEKTRINRDVLFSYIQLDETSFRMDNLKVIKGERDNAPDNAIADNFFSLALETRRVMTLHKINNSYLVGNLRAPAFMCIPQ